jgi:hypothetical protein
METETNDYPTKEEILQNIYTIDEELVKLIKEWKYIYLPNWRDKPPYQKFYHLCLLSDIICKYYKTRKIKHEISTCYCFIVDEKIILHDIDRISILSTLHEIAHYIFKANEKRACYWSVSVFKECFPTLYKGLKWKGHLLVKE